MNCQAIQNRILALPDPRHIPEPLREHVLACAVCLAWAGPALADPPALNKTEPKKKPEPGKFLRVKRDKNDTPVALETAIVRYVPAAGKDVATTHITNGAYRLHPVEWNIGEAAGHLAAFCTARSTTPLRSCSADLVSRRMGGAVSVTTDVTYLEAIRAGMRDAMISICISESSNMMCWWLAIGVPCSDPPRTRSSRNS